VSILFKINLTSEDEDIDNKKDDNIALKVKAFDEIVRECKDEVESSDIEHKIHVLKLLYGLEVDDNNVTSVDDTLDDYVRGQINDSHMEVNENKINSIKSIILSIDEIVEKLAVE